MIPDLEKQKHIYTMEKAKHQATAEMMQDIYMLVAIGRKTIMEY